MAMTPEELRRETGTREVIPYESMWERIRKLGPAALVGGGLVLLTLYGLYRWVTS